VLGLRDGTVLTTGGTFRAPIVVDCSGWRGAVVNGGRTPDPHRSPCSFGLEGHTPVRGEGLAFWVDGRLLRRGLGWVFPVGSGSLVGLGSYAGASRLGPALERLLGELGTAARGYHGGFFPSRLLHPTVGRVFAVGDAAGQCLPLTAEGIRPAIVFGTACGRLVQRVLDGRLVLGDALAQYTRLVEGYRWAYRLLAAAQWVAAHAPARWLGVLAGLAGREPFLSRWWPRYGRFGRLAPARQPLAA
jgi:flavin-dependent dehydrogenase